MNSGAHSERLAYQPHTAASQSLVYSHDSVAARQGGNDLNQSLPATQPRAASMRQTETRYQAAADGDVSRNIGVRPAGPPPSVPSTSYVSNNVPLTSNMDVIQPSVPVSSSTQQVTADQHKSQRDSFDLPAPPTPPSSGAVPSALSGDQLPTPPMMITPPPDADGHFSALQLPQYLPPPELVASVASGDQPAVWHSNDGSNVASAVVDNNSDSSSLVAAQQTDDQPLVRDTRSDLLAAIREGLCILYSLPETCILCSEFLLR